ncbi:hypothetical protein RRG08_011196 [Elysia crispata]|uniref:Uncharacterized protein n=1 Tax=Elysia crispata TaxID=231223 RepID=A0AAE0ZQJ4_9GAST|nr:hypothetical protein RRG08_011196 [Elysia crispata]
MFNVSEAQVLLDSIPTDYGPAEELFSGCHSPGQYFTTFFDNSIVDDLDLSRRPCTSLSRNAESAQLPVQIY